MNSALLGAVRSERQRRNAPAVLALARERDSDTSANAHSTVWSRLKNHLGEIHRAAKLRVAFARLEDGVFILPGRGHKLDEVRSELVEARIPASSITQLPVAGIGSVEIASLRFYLAAVLMAALVRIGVAVRLSRATKPYMNLLFGYAWLRRNIKDTKSSGFWIIIGDLSPFLIGFCAALRRENRRFASWQYGYQDFKPFPVRPDLAFVLNQKGMELSRVDDASSRASVFQRETIRPVAVKFPSRRTGAVGVVLNAFSLPDVFSKILRIQNHLDCKILVRPHPRDSAFSATAMEQNVEISRSGSLDEFCQQVDWVICGNTTSALKILGNGIPVCQFFGFDLFFEDHFEYRKMGLLPAFSRVSEISEWSLRDFYDGSDPSPLLREIFGRDGLPGVRPLSELKHCL